MSSELRTSAMPRHRSRTSRASPASQATFLSASSANALISDLRPTTLSPQTLQYINAFLDEMLSLLISSAASLNPLHLRSQGVPAVFSGNKASGESTGPRTLGRAAVGEAELELRSWYETHPIAKRGSGGFPPEGKGRGMTADNERAGAAFPVGEAVVLMRVKCATFSTLASQQGPSKAVEDSAMRTWKGVGGDTSEETFGPAGLWLTAILEHVCEHVLSRLAGVVARDSSITTAGPAHLYTALCEDESVLGFFKRMQIKDALEETNRSYVRKGGPLRTSLSANFAESTGSLPFVRDKSIGFGRKMSNPPSAFDAVRGSGETTRIGSGIAGGGTNGKSLPSSGQKGSSNAHERSGSVLIVTTRSIIGAFHEHQDTDGSGSNRSKSPQEEEEDFDALMRSGETMRISLTPSRLKTFELANARKTSPGSSPQPATLRRSREALTFDASPRQATELAPPLPHDPSSRAAPVRQSRSRASSAAQRLQARGTVTIEEDSDEGDNDLPGRLKSRKQSLAELLASEPADKTLDPSGSRKASPDKVRRTVPAVVLGTPPPPVSDETMPQPFMIPGTSTGPSVNRPDRDVELLDDDEDLTLSGAKPRKQSSAQELAAFLNTTAPPPDTRTSANLDGDLPAASTKTSKGFRGLISKVTGKKKDDARGSLPNSASQRNSENPEERVVVFHRQRSTPNVESPSEPKSPPRHHKDEAANLAPSEKGLLRKHSHSRVLNGRVAEGAAAITLSSAVASATANDKDDNRPAVLSAIEGNSSTWAKQPVPLPRQVMAVPLPRGELKDERIWLDPTGQPSDSYVGASKASQSPYSADKHNQPLSTGTSDAVSYFTANEGGVDGNYGSDAGSEEMPRLPTAIRSPSIKTVQAAPGPLGATPPTGPISLPHPSPPMMSLSDLVPLRQLLSHATTASECRLLLSAILTQWRVPHSSTDPDLTPETRVTAWLLGGRDGPVSPFSPGVTTSSTSTNPESTPSEDGVPTPTMEQSAELHPRQQAEHADQDPAEQAESGEDELTSEITDDDASISKEEMEGMPSFAKTALRVGARVASAIVPRVISVGDGDSREEEGSQVTSKGEEPIGR